MLDLLDKPMRINNVGQLLTDLKGALAKPEWLGLEVSDPEYLEVGTQKILKILKSVKKDPDKYLLPPDPITLVDDPTSPSAASVTWTGQGGDDGVRRRNSASDGLRAHSTFDVLRQKTQEHNEHKTYIDMMDASDPDDLRRIKNALKAAFYLRSALFSNWPRHSVSESKTMNWKATRRLHALYFSRIWECVLQLTHVLHLIGVGYLEPPTGAAFNATLTDGAAVDDLRQSPGPAILFSIVFLMLEFVDLSVLIRVESRERSAAQNRHMFLGICCGILLFDSFWALIAYQSGDFASYPDGMRALGKVVRATLVAVRWRQIRLGFTLLSNVLLGILPVLLMFFAVVVFAAAFAHANFVDGGAAAARGGDPCLGPACYDTYGHAIFNMLLYETSDNCKCVRLLKVRPCTSFFLFFSHHMHVSDPGLMIPVIHGSRVGLLRVLYFFLTFALFVVIGNTLLAKVFEAFQLQRALRRRSNKIALQESLLEAFNVLRGSTYKKDPGGGPGKWEGGEESINKRQWHRVMRLVYGDSVLGSCVPSGYKKGQQDLFFELCDYAGDNILHQDEFLDVCKIALEAPVYVMLKRVAFVSTDDENGNGSNGGETKVQITIDSSHVERVEIEFWVVTSDSDYTCRRFLSYNRSAHRHTFGFPVKNLQKALKKLQDTMPSRPSSTAVIFIRVCDDQCAFCQETRDTFLDQPDYNVEDSVVPGTFSWSHPQMLHITEQSASLRSIPMIGASRSRGRSRGSSLDGAGGSEDFGGSSKVSVQSALRQASETVRQAAVWHTAKPSAFKVASKRPSTLGTTLRTRRPSAREPLPPSMAAMLNDEIDDVGAPVQENDDRNADTENYGLHIIVPCATSYCQLLLLLALDASVMMYLDIWFSLVVTFEIVCFAVWTKFARRLHNLRAKRGRTCLAWRQQFVVMWKRKVIRKGTVQGAEYPRLDLLLALLTGPVCAGLHVWAISTGEGELALSHTVLANLRALRLLRLVFHSNAVIRLMLRARCGWRCCDRAGRRGCVQGVARACDTRDIQRALARILKVLLQMALVLGLITYVFCAFCMLFFAGMAECNVWWNDTMAEPCVPTVEEFAEGFPSVVNFENLQRSFVALVEIGIVGNAWTSLMYALQSYVHKVYGVYGEWLLLIPIVYLFLANFVVLNVIVSQILELIDSYRSKRRKREHQDVKRFTKHLGLELGVNVTQEEAQRLLADCMKNTPRSARDLAVRVKAHVANNAVTTAFQVAPQVYGTVASFLRARLESQLYDGAQDGVGYKGLWGHPKSGHRYTSVRLVRKQRMAFVTTFEPDELTAAAGMDVSDEEETAPQRLSAVFHDEEGKGEDGGGEAVESATAPAADSAAQSEVEQKQQQNEQQQQRRAASNDSSRPEHRGGEMKETADGAAAASGRKEEDRTGAREWSIVFGDGNGVGRQPPKTPGGAVRMRSSLQDIISQSNSTATATASTRSSSSSSSSATATSSRTDLSVRRGAGRKDHHDVPTVRTTLSLAEITR